MPAMLALPSLAVLTVCLLACVCCPSLASPPLRFNLRPETPFSRGLVFSAAASSQQPKLSRGSIVFPGTPDVRPTPQPPTASPVTKGTVAVVQAGAAADGNVWFPTIGVRNRVPVQSCPVSDTLTLSMEGDDVKLLNPDNCAPGQWMVLGEGCQPVCQPRPCNQGQVELNGKCVDPLEPAVCGKGQTLYVDLRGDAFCDCEQHHFYHAWSGQCYELRERGPCDFGFFLDVDEQGKADCMVDPCQADHYEHDPKTNRCYRKVFVGYCPKTNLQFKTSEGTVDCSETDIRNLFDRAITRSCTAGSRVGHQGSCREEFVVPTSTVWARSLNQRCDSGAISIGGGPCRRINSFF